MKRRFVMSKQRSDKASEDALSCQSKGATKRAKRRFVRSKQRSDKASEATLCHVKASFDAPKVFKEKLYGTSVAQLG